MGLTYEVSDSDFEIIETGAYKGRLEALSESTEGQYGPSVLWEFSLPDMPDMPNRWAWSDAKVTVRNKTGRWAAALGAELVKGVNLDLMSLIGNECILDIVVVTKEDGQESNRIANVRPATGGKPRRSVPKMDQEGLS